MCSRKATYRVQFWQRFYRISYTIKHNISLFCQSYLYRDIALIFRDVFPSNVIGTVKTLHHYARSRLIVNGFRDFEVLPASLINLWFTCRTFTVVELNCTFGHPLITPINNTNNRVILPILSNSQSCLQHQNDYGGKQGDDSSERSVGVVE